MSDKNLYQRLNAIMAKVSRVHKDKFVSTGGGGGYKAVQHDEVTRSIQPELVANGVFVSVSHTKSELEQIQTTRKAGTAGAYTVNEYQVTIHVDVTFVNMDNPDEKLTVSGFAYALDGGDKACGKALSMAVKNILLKNFMLESCDDEEARDIEREKGGSMKMTANAKLTAGKQKGRIIKDIPDVELVSILRWIDSLAEPPRGALMDDFKMLKNEYEKRGLNK